MDGKMQSIDDKMQSSTSTNPANFDLEETCAIIETGLGKNAADLYRMNARGMPAQQSSLTDRDLELISRLTTSIVSAVMANLDQRVTKIETQVEERKALLPPPSIDTKTAVSKIVREYVANNNVGYQIAWGTLYREFGYRTHTNPSIAAKNRGMSVIDYIETEGQIDTLLAVAMDIFK